MAPYGLLFDYQHNLIVVDQGNHRIQIFTQHQKFKAMFGQKGKTKGNFLNPKVAAIDQDGRIVVSDPGNSRVQIFTGNGQHVKEFPTTLHIDVRGIAVDHSGNIILSDCTPNKRIQFYSPDGDLLHVIGQGIVAIPMGLAVDRFGNVAVCDADAVHILSKDGDLIQTIGVGRLRSPMALTMDKEGTLYITENSGGAVQRVSIYV